MFALNLPYANTKIVVRNEKQMVFDFLRKRFVALTPEEWVRRHLIGFLISHCGAQPMRIVQEYAVAMNGSPQRADVVVVDDRACPLMLVECKAAGIGIDRQVLAQAVRYNSVLGARYVVLTNGLVHYCYEYAEGRYTRMDRFPRL